MVKLQIPTSPEEVLPDRQALFREAMSRVAGAVHLITTDGPAGRGGLTATAVTSVSDTPPTVLVCLNRSSRTAPILRKNMAFAVSTLAAGQQDLADIFAGRTAAAGEARFTHGAWRRGAAGQPVLDDALMHFEARVLDVRPVASHYVVLGEVVGIGLGPDHRGLVYRHRAYHAV